MDVGIMHALNVFSETTFNQSRGLIFKSIYIRHNDRLKYIKEKMTDFKILEIWEHEWDTGLFLE